MPRAYSGCAPARLNDNLSSGFHQATHHQAETNQARGALDMARRRLDRHLRQRGIFMPHALFAPIPALPAGASTVDGALLKFASALVAMRESAAAIGEEKIAVQIEAFLRRAASLGMTPAADAVDFSGKALAFEVLQKLSACHFERPALHREQVAAYATMAVFARVLAGDALALAEDANKKPAALPAAVAL